MTTLAFCRDHGVVEYDPLTERCPYCLQQTEPVDEQTWYGVIASHAREKTGIERHF